MRELTGVTTDQQWRDYVAKQLVNSRTIEVPETKELLKQPAP